MSRSKPVSCPRCGRSVPYLTWKRVCNGCHSVWERMGRPDPFPPPKFTRDLESRLRETAHLGRGGVPVREIAARLGITERQVWRYKKMIKESLDIGQEPPVSLPGETEEPDHENAGSGTRAQPVGTP